MEEKLISFKTAQLAKEKGCELSLYIPSDNIDGADILCTQSLLQKWLREKHNVHIWVFPLSLNNYQYNYFKDGGYTFGVSGHTTYEEALEIGLRQGLTLIK